ncbi:hypothetical protein AC1031_000006 [Aphanomyces cochlioides]|nr:hypothetical protein AC1031_000006 [Aphanomyces cochlioides]
MKLFAFISVVFTVVTESVLGATAPGIAAGVTGGSSATPVYPTTIAQLKTYLSDSTPRVIVSNKGFNFRGTESTKTETGCQPDYTRACIAKNNGYNGQNVIIASWGGFNGTGGCSNGLPVTITYDLAGYTNPLIIASNKTLRGEGLKGVITGKGIQLKGDNIIIQNIHITNLNPSLVWVVMPSKF